MTKNISNLKTIFFGTDDFSVTVFDALMSAGIEPVLAITPPDKPVGRKQVITPPPLKVWAEKNDFDVLQPEKLDDDFVSELANTEWDLFIVVSYGKIIPKNILDLPKHKTLNVHPSLLPKLRGPSPIQSTILNDDNETGVTIMLMDEEVDHGPIISQARIAFDRSSGDDSWPLKASTLREILAEASGEVLAETIPEWIAGTITPEEQNHDKATFTKILTKKDGELDIENGDAYQNFLKIQALDEWPGTHFFVTPKDKQIRVKITDASFEKGTLTVHRVIPEGKNEMDYQDFLVRTK